MLNKYGGQNIYIERKGGLVNLIKNPLYFMDKDAINIKTNIDGLPIFKSSFDAPWPMLIGDDFFTPLVAAIFCRNNKPYPLEECVTDLILERAGLNWTWKNNKARLLYNIKLFVSFDIHQWIQTRDTVRKRPIWVKLDDFFRCVTLQFDVWPWKTIGHFFYAASSFVHHFVAIGEFKLKLVRKRPIWFKFDDF